MAALVVGCVAVPDRNPVPLALEVPAAWSSEAYALTSAATKLSQWWMRFDDSAMNALVLAAQDAHTSVIAARAAVQQAIALREGAQANLSPKLNLSASAQRSRSGDGSPANNVQTGLNGDWAPDVSGAKQRAVDASTANVQAQEARLGGAQGSIAAAVALNYIALRSAQERLAIAKGSLASQRDTLQITRWRNQAGLIGAVEVEQAFAAAGETGAQVPPLEAVVENTLHALAVQAGKPPAALQRALATAAAVPVSNADFGPGSPKDALAQRADVRAAKHLLGQASAQLEQALALRYLVLDLAGNAGLAAGSVQGLASGGTTVLGVVLSLVAPLWDGGAANANIRAQQATLAQAQANYRAAELLALQEVEDAMAQMRSDTLRLAQLQQVAVAAANAARMARQRFSSGLVDFQVVLETQRNEFASQDSLALARATVSSDQVRLYNALGGGWQVDFQQTTAAKPIPS
jgi:multidrug efflux system outer membrane protein